MVERTLRGCRQSPFRGIRMRRLRLVSIAIPAILVASFSITPASASGAGVGIVPQGTQSDAAYAQSGAANHVKNVFAKIEEHTSELQSHLNLVCRLLLEKKKI